VDGIALHEESAREQKSRGKNYFIGKGKGKDERIEVALST